jgi:hypothetical protein
MRNEYHVTSSKVPHQYLSFPVTQASPSPGAYTDLGGMVNAQAHFRLCHIKHLPVFWVAKIVKNLTYEATVAF